MTDPALMSFERDEFLSPYVGADQVALGRDTEGYLIKGRKFIRDEMRRETIFGHPPPLNGESDHSGSFANAGSGHARR